MFRKHFGPQNSLQLQPTVVLPVYSPKTNSSLLKEAENDKERIVSQPSISQVAISFTPTLTGFGPP